MFYSEAGWQYYVHCVAVQQLSPYLMCINNSESYTAVLNALHHYTAQRQTKSEFI
jgi:HD superfamily phosphohydrolase YqeK